MTERYAHLAPDPKDSRRIRVMEKLSTATLIIEITALTAGFIWLMYGLLPDLITA